MLRPCHAGLLALLTLAAPALAGPLGFRVDMAHAKPHSEQGSVTPARPQSDATGPGPRAFGDAYDNEIQLMDLDLLQGQYLWSGVGGQSIPYSGAPTITGQTFFSGANVSASASETPLGGDVFNIILTCSVASGELLPTGLTLPGGTPLRSLNWQVGGAGFGDRDGSPDGFNPFPAAPSWDLLDGHVAGYAGATQLFTFPGEGVPAFGLTDVDLFMTVIGADGLGLTSIEINLLARPTPTPGTLALAAVSLLAARRRRSGD